MGGCRGRFVYQHTPPGPVGTISLAAQLLRSQSAASVDEDPVRKRWLPLFLVALFVVSCRPPRPPLRIDHPDPIVKIPAMKKAVREQDQRQTELLISDLDSDDAAVRMFAIEALQRLTGEDLGYRYWDGESDRRPAVQRWRAWLDEQTTAP